MASYDVARNICWALPQLGVRGEPRLREREGGDAVPERGDGAGAKVRYQNTALISLAVKRHRLPWLG